MRVRETKKERERERERKEREREKEREKIPLKNKRRIKQVFFPSHDNAHTTYRQTSTPCPPPDSPQECGLETERKERVGEKEEEMRKRVKARVKE